MFPNLVWNIDYSCHKTYKCILLLFIAQVFCSKHWISLMLCFCSHPSVLWRSWLDGRKGIRPVKT